MKDRFQILSLDGGGIKGLFSAAVLAFLEEDLNTNVIDHFDLITGTSTGGIIALGLGAGLRSREIVEFYVSNCHQIFNAHFLSPLKHFFKSKYSANPLENALKDCFGEKRLADSCKRLVITSYNISDDSVYLFKTPHHDRLRRDYKVPMWKIARATSAAPTYFRAFSGIDNVRLIDGGVWANNPSIVGITEAVSLFNIPLGDIYVLNMGTTDEVKHYPSYLDKGGLIKWRKAALSIILHGQSIGAWTQSQHLIGKDHIERLDPKVPDGLFALDKLSTGALLSKAAHESRHFCPRFKELFMEHIASEYKPIYQ